MNSNALHLLPPTYDQSSTRGDSRLMLAAPMLAQPLPPIPPIEYEEAGFNETRNHICRQGFENAVSYHIQEATDSNCDVSLLLKFLNKFFQK